MNKPKFQSNLIQLFKNKGLQETTINNYIRNLELINDGKPFTNLSFLNDVSGIKEKLVKYKKTTIRNYYASIVAVLSIMKSKKKLLNEYEKILEYQQTEVEKSSSEKAETQEDYPTVQEIKDISNELMNKDLTKYDNILNYMILSLYTKIQPRRNKDYLEMKIVKRINKNDSEKYNYFDVLNRVFIFNQYKTKKIYGKQVLDIPNELYEILLKYLEVHPMKHRYDLDERIPLLLGNSINYITRLLNKIFKRNVGSTILRHAFLTNKYEGGKVDNFSESIKDANAMGHSITSQKLTYIKNLI